ncbi:MAG: hypothetical protein ACRDD7_02190 [Peptostreptococcaceae bacterium]
MAKKLMETTIPMNFTQVMNNFGWDWDAAETSKIYSITFMAISDFLALAKSQETKTALAIEDLKGNLLLAGVVTYHANENEDMPGNWSYQFTTDKEDLKEAKVYKSTDLQFQKVFGNTAHNLYSVAFPGPEIVQSIMESAINILNQWLDANASATETVEIEEPGYFVASVAIEGGEKVTSVVPDGAMKRLIKDDSALEQ